jgi:hypothetical protein
MRRVLATIALVVSPLTLASCSHSDLTAPCTASADTSMRFALISDTPSPRRQVQRNCGPMRPINW